jgi:hypothetical protein
LREDLTERSWIEAAERSFNLGGIRKFASLGLRQSFQNGGQMSRIDRFRLSLALGEMEHGARDLVLALCRQAAHSFKGLFQELRHSVKICHIIMK